MRKSVLLALWLLLIGTAVLAQTKDQKEVSEAVEKLKKAMLDADAPALQALTADALSYGHSSGAIEDKTTFINALTSGQSDFKTLEISGQQITIAGKTALVRHNMTADIQDKGKDVMVKLGVLLVWQKQKDGWKLLARQAYKL